MRLLWCWDASTQIFAVVLLIVFQKNGKDVKRRVFEPGN